MDSNWRAGILAAGFSAIALLLAFLAQRRRERLSEAYLRSHEAEVARERWSNRRREGYEKLGEAVRVARRLGHRGEGRAHAAFLSAGSDRPGGKERGQTSLFSAEKGMVEARSQR